MNSHFVVPGFVANPKRFNVAITRAKAVVCTLVGAGGMVSSCFEPGCDKWVQTLSCHSFCVA